MQEFFLRGLLAREEMHVVDEQGIAFSERFAESPQLTEAHGRQESIGEIFSGDKPNLPIRMSLAQADIDSFEQMSLARPHRPVKHQGIGSLARILNDAHGGGMCDAV